MKELSKLEIKKLIGKEDPIILDIGCYDGKDSVELASLFNSCEIHCFEADFRSIKLFKHINKNTKHKLFLHEIAIGSVDGKINFYLSDSETRRHYKFQKEWSASSSIKKPKVHLELFKDVQFNKKVKVQCCKLDTWCEKKWDWGNINNKIIDLIWCDVNGAEKDLILGGMNVLNNFTRYFYTEFCAKELYEGSLTYRQILKLLPNFNVVSVYNFQGNFGNLLLKNKNL